MSLIWTSKSGRVGWSEVFCDHCQKSIGVMSRQEIGELASGGITPLCFECDTVGAEQVPVMMSNCFDGQISNRFVMKVGAQHFFVDYDEPSPTRYFTPISGALFLSLLGHIVKG